MPTLNWIGRKAVENHHRQVPFHLLKDVPELSVGDPGAGNLLVEGDNLLALKALLPYYGGQVKCIYIDPPYNTGNEGWIYNDNVNSPEMREWLGRTVGKEAEDLCRHDKWLCMMYPRLCLLREMLRDDGAIFVSIDDNEVQSLRFLMDEIFGRDNFVATVIWQKKQSPQNDAINLSDMHDYVVLYAKRAKQNRDDPAGWNRGMIPRDEIQDARYLNPDSDPRGSWTSSDYTCNKTSDERPNLYYGIENPNTGATVYPSRTRVWAYDPEAHAINLSENRVWWGANGEGRPRIKKYLNEVQAGLVPTTWWGRDFAGDNQEGKRELRRLSLAGIEFATPKPSRLIKRILQIATNPGDIILDSFAGSGTTGHAVMQLNKEDGGNRRFIMVEMDPNICRNVTAERVKRVSEGYANGGGKAVEGLGSGFRFAVLGDALFDERGSIRNTVRFGDLARHVYFVETGEPLGARASRPHSPLLGIHNGKGIYLLYNGILKDKSPDGGNVLTTPVLSFLPKHAGPKVIYGTACRLGADRLRREGIVFKQLPYKLKVDAR
jgi:site-specific DNA-methyltransferase (adenine-specific)/adenine-specific DNA-methyltransferase